MSFIDCPNCHYDFKNGFTLRNSEGKKFFIICGRCTKQFEIATSVLISDSKKIEFEIPIKLKSEYSLWFMTIKKKFIGEKRVLIIISIFFFC